MRLGWSRAPSAPSNLTRYQFAKALVEFDFAISGGAVNFHNPALFCYSAHSASATE
jgi:hypothetical protein